MKIKIDKLGINGEGVGRITSGVDKDKVCFVDFLLPQEVAEIDIIKNTSSFCKGRVVEIVETSKDRVNAPCPYFGECGGCDLQHLNCNSQTNFKKELIRETIEKIAKIECNPEDTVRLNDYHYRNKMVFPISVKDGKVIIGMYKPNSHEIIEINKCLIADDKINELLNNAQEFFNNNKKDEYNYLRYLVVRVSGNELLVTIVASKKIDLADYYANLQKMTYSSGLSLVIGDDRNNILSGKYVHINGMTKLNLCDFEIKYSVDNLGFLQVNNEIKTELYNEVVKNIKNDDVVIDAYSGAGLLTAIISKHCKHAVGIEIVDSSVKSAKDMAIKNGISNVEFYLDDVKNRLPNLLSRFENVTIVLDPPRQGCDRLVIEKILENSSKIPKIIYISCGPSTLARDLCLLKEKYVINKIIPMDMFPQTKHVETLVVLERKE